MFIFIQYNDKYTIIQGLSFVTNLDSFMVPLKMA